MKKIKFKSMRSRLTFWFLIIALLPLLIVITISFEQEKRSTENETINKLVAIRNLKVQQFNNWLDERIGDLQIMSGDFEIRGLEDYLINGSKNPENIKKMEIAKELLFRCLRNYTDYEEIFIVNAKNGNVAISTRSNFEGMNKSKDAYFTEPLKTGEIYIKDIYYSKTLNKSEMTLSIPIFCLGHSKHIIGVLVARINLEKSLYALLQNRTGLGKSGETLIVNKDLLALNELRWFDDAPLNLKISAEPAVKASQRKSGIVSAKDYRKVNVMAAYTYIPETGWGFVCKQDMYELNAPIRAMLINFAVLFCLTFIIIYFIALYVSKMISKPLVDMGFNAQKIRSGDYSTRNIVGSEDEVGSLANSINKMAASIESHIAIQTGIAGVSEAMVGQSTMQEFGSELLKQLMEITKSNMAAFYILNEADSKFEHFTSIGANEELLRPFNSENPEGEFGNAISTKEIFYLRDIPENSVFKFKTTAGDIIPKEIITIPIIIDNIVTALISLINIHKFSDESYDVLKQSWISINSSYSSLLANERTRILADTLSKINLRLEAQTEELQEQTEELQSQSEELHQTTDELQEQNIELETQKQQIEEANRLKSEFLSNMSHELRTPLNSIMALSNVLIMQAKDKLTKEENNYLEIVLRNGTQLLSLINDILDLSKIEAGKMDVNLSSFSLNVMLNNIKESLKPIAIEKKLDFKLSISDDLPAIETDEVKLHQVLQNIISNAVKFTENGYISINTSFDDKNVCVNVKDTGIGISKNNISYIFDEFRQIDGSSSRQFEGTGLGLAIANKMIKVLGGSINVKSIPGEGSLFSVTIPLKGNIEIGASEVHNIQGNQHVISEPEKKTVLVVDDASEMVNTISEFLNSSGYKVINATSGRMALELAEKHHPFAITLDIVMPEMDGWEVLQLLKANSETKDIPVIVVSVSDDKETGFALGAVGYIQKPIDKNMLISEINKLHNNPKSVMIVDDNEIDRKQMAKIIEAEDINIVLADNGMECVECLQKHVPDVLVLDLMMPKMDGFQVINRIRKDKKTQNLPIIVVTAKDLSNEDKKILSENVISVLEKNDSTPQKLFLEIKRILDRLENLPKIFNPEKKDSDIRILIVEDTEAAVIQLKSILENKNYKVDVASGGKQALEYIKHTIPDGIILDLMMPKIDGFDVLENIRSTPETREIPVLVLTAKNLTKNDLARLSANNVQQLLQKGDINKNELMQKLKAMLVIKPVSTEITAAKSKPKQENNKTIIIPDTKLKRILVVEDNPDNMITAEAILGHKYEISEAFNGETGLDKILNEKPDLVLLDISLPKKDGMEIIGIVKNNSDTADIPIIAVTAKAMKEDQEKILAAGFDDLVLKPIDPALLIKTIEKQLRKN